MINYKQIEECITSIGANCYLVEEQSDDELKGGRLVCAEFQNQGSRTGISFWLHSSPDRILVGLWSGIIYEMRDTERILEFLNDVFAAKQLPSGCTPSVFPATLMTKYDLTSE